MPHAAQPCAFCIFADTPYAKALGEPEPRRARLGDRGRSGAPGGALRGRGGGRPAKQAGRGRKRARGVAVATVRLAHARQQRAVDLARLKGVRVVVRACAPPLF